MASPVLLAISSRVTWAKGRLANRTSRAEARKAVADRAANETKANTLTRAKEGLNREGKGFFLFYSAGRAMGRRRNS